jgi:hypothetical protein
MAESWLKATGFAAPEEPEGSKHPFPLNWMLPKEVEAAEFRSKAKVS